MTIIIVIMIIIAMIMIIIIIMTITITCLVGRCLGARRPPNVPLSVKVPPP